MAAETPKPAAKARGRRTKASAKAARTPKRNVSLRQITDLGALERFRRGLDGSEDQGGNRPTSPYRQIPAIFRGINLLSSTSASVPFEIWDEVDDEPVVGDPIVEFFRRPGGAALTWRQWMEALVPEYHGGQVHLWQWPRNTRLDRLPDELRIVRATPHRSRDNRGNVYAIDGWKVAGRRDPVPVEAVIRIAYATDPMDPYRGISPLEPGRNAIDAEYMASIYQRAVLARGGAPGTVISFKGDPDDLGEETQDELADEWQSKFGAASSGGGVAVLNGEWDTKILGRTSRELEFAELRKQWVAEASRLLNIPPFFLANFEGIGLGHEGLRQQWRQLFETNLIPFLDKIAQALTEHVIRVYNPRFVGIFNLDRIEALRDDLLQKQQVAAGYVGMNVPFDQVNEGLDLGFDVDGDRMPWAKEALVNSGMTTARATVAASELPPVDLDELRREVREELEKEAAEAAKESADDAEAKRESRERRDREEAEKAAELAKEAAEERAAKDEELGATLRMSAAVGYDGLGPDAPIEVHDQVEGDERAREKVVKVEDSPKEDEPKPRRPNRRRRAKLWAKWVKDSASSERKIAGRVRREINAMRQSVLRRMIRINEQRGGVEAARAFSVEERAPARISAGDIPDILAEVIPDGILSALSATIGDAYRAGALSAEDVLLEMGVEIDDLFEFQKRRLPKLVDGYVDKRLGTGSPTRVTDAIRKAVNIAIVEGLHEGESPAKLAKRIRGVFSASLERATTIARTEAGIAMSTANFVRSQAHGVRHHMWLSARDGRVRDQHAHLDGEIVEVGKPFPNRLLHPKDSGGAPEEVINCRCTVVPLTRRQSAKLVDGGGAPTPELESDISGEGLVGAAPVRKPPADDDRFRQNQ